MLNSGVSAMQESVGGGHDRRLSFVSSRKVVVVGSFEQGSFEQGWWCVDRRNTPPSRVSSKGGVEGVSTKATPPPSRFSSEGGVEGVLTKETPLRLAF